MRDIKATTCCGSPSSETGFYQRKNERSNSPISTVAQPLINWSRITKIIGIETHGCPFCQYDILILNQSYDEKQ